MKQIEYMTNEYIQHIVSEIFDLIAELEKYSAYNGDVLNSEINGMRRRAEKIKLALKDDEEI